MRSLGFLLLNVLQALFLCFWTVLWSSAAALAALFNRDAGLTLPRLFWAPALIKATGSSVDLVPGAQLDWSRPHLFVANHQSMFDIPVLMATLPVNARMVAKHTLKYVPFLGWSMAAVGMLFVDRRKGAQALQSLTRAAETLRKGANVVAFPEGTRSHDGRILPFKKGPFVLALAAGVPIVPVALEGTSKVLPSGGFKLRPYRCRMKIGEPVPTEGLTEADRDALMRRVRDELIELHVSIGGAGGATESSAATGRGDVSPAQVHARDPQAAGDAP